MQSRALNEMRAGRGRGNKTAALCCLRGRSAVMVVAVALAVLVCCQAPAQKVMNLLPTAFIRAPQTVTNLQVALWDTGIPGQRECLTELVRAFQSVHPGVRVCLEWRDAAEAEHWVPRWCDGFRQYAPDVTVMTDLWVRQYRRDLLVLDRELRHDLQQRFVPAVLAQGGEPGPLRGVPWSVATPALYYRSDLLAEAGIKPPGDFAELVECAAALADPPERYGFGLPGVGGGAEELLYALAVAAGGEMADEEGKIAPTAQPFETALGLLVELQSRGALEPEVLTWTEVELAEMLVEGRLAMMVGGPWLGAMLEDAKKRAEGEAEEEAEEAAERGLEYAIVPLPREPEGAVHVTVDWLVAFRDTDRSEQALKLLAFLAQAQSQRALTTLGGVPATWGLCAEMGRVAPWAAHTEGLAQGRGLPRRDWPRLKAQLGNALTYALSGRQGVSEALESAEDVTP